jgi:hypothetical protein
MRQFSIRLCALHVANHYTGLWHRHLGPVQMHLWSHVLIDYDGKVHGVATVFRPTARALDDGESCEIKRLSTDGTRNACSALYGAACRHARYHGYALIHTYTQAGEPGTSLVAAGFTRSNLRVQKGRIATVRWTRRLRSSTAVQDITDMSSAAVQDMIDR